MNEQWKDIPEYEGFYSVSNNGQVRSKPRDLPCMRSGKRRWKGGVMKPHRDIMGYDSVVLSKNAKTHRRFIHRLVAMVFLEDYSDGKEVDHINGDRVDNRVDNLRMVTRSENTSNSKKMKNCSSKYKGVSWNKRSKKWIARVHDGKRVQLHIGYFDDEIEAARAYDRRAVELKGEYAKTNVKLGLLQEENSNEK